MERTGTTLGDMARLVGCSKRTISLWANGQVIPDTVYVFRIEMVTDGGVPATSWLGTEIAKAAWVARFGSLP